MLTFTKNETIYFYIFLEKNQDKNKLKDYAFVIYPSQGYHDELFEF
jgi:hypothetical protein